MAGISRSVTITAMYIMLVTSLSHEQALTIIRQCRPQAGPNIGFRTQLKDYYDKYAEVVSVSVETGSGQPGHIFSGSSGSDPVYKLSGSDPDWIT